MVGGIQVNKVTKADCLEGMRKIEDDTFDCIITSPPYNKMGLAGGGKVRTMTSDQVEDLIRTKANEFSSDGRRKSDRYNYHEKGNAVWKGFDIDYNEYDDAMPEDEYQAFMVDCLNEMMRIVKPDGSVFFNHKPRRHQNTAHLATDFISRSNAIIYQEIIWDRGNSPNIRGDVLVPCTERVYWLRKEKPRVFRDQLDRRYRTEVWRISPSKQKGHPAPFPSKLVENCILLSTQRGDLVFDPFMGSGTTALVAERLGRNWCGFEMDQKYIDLLEAPFDIFGPPKSGDSQPETLTLDDLFGLDDDNK